MKWIVLSMLIPTSLLAKGLDKLQPDTEAPPAKEENKNQDPGNTTIIIQQTPVKTEAAPSKEEEEEEEGEEEAGKEQPPQQPAAPPPAPVEPGFQKFYFGTGISWINLTASEGSWHSATTGDIEFGYKAMKFQDKYDIYGTFRYRPADVTVEHAQRSYRGVVETFLFGAKGQMSLGPKLVPFATAELGMSQSSLKVIDGLPDGKQSLAKSGVDLSIGGGVSYIVLDKLAAGTRMTLGAGAFKTIQFGIDLRYLF